MTELARQIEALMFVSPDPLPLVRLCEVTEASPEKPYLCLKIDLNQRDFSELLADTGQLNVPDLSTRRGYFVGKVDDALTDLHPTPDRVSRA